MRLALTDEQRELQAVTRDLMTDLCTPAVLRAGAGSAQHTALARGLRELGAWGLLVSDKQRGLGLDECSLVPFLEEAGGAAVPLPLIDTVAVAPGVLAALGRDAELAAGAVRCVCDPAGTGVVGLATGSDLLLRGGQGGEGSITVVDLADAVLTEQTGVDPAGDLRRVTGGRELAVIDDPQVVAQAWHRGVLGASAELVGLARRMLTMTVEYVGERRQFGVPIGSFQAVKHQLASALIAVEFAAATVARAAALLAAEDPSAPLHVGSAKALASDAAQQVARTALQAHGAIGYTTEYDLHLFAKRAWSLASSWGTAPWHRDRVATLLGLPRTGAAPRH